MNSNNALLSVFDKTGIVEFARALYELGWKLFSSGGTAKVIAEAGIPVTDVAELTGYPSILDHRVVTLHPKVHGGILARPDLESHQADMREHDLSPFGLVVVNLYPFSDTVKSGASFNECIEKIDVGGPTMVRAAAKNHAHVGVVTDPDQYPQVLDELRENNELSSSTRKELAVEAFAHTAAYDLAVVEWLSEGGYKGKLGKKVRELGYGENRWQSPASLYQWVGNNDPLALHRFTLVEGQNPGFVNMTDVDRELQTATHILAYFEHNFDKKPYVAIAVKHGNPCGAAVGNTPEEALKLMLTGDKRAVFGAVVLVNFPITGELAELLLHHESDIRRLLDGICAPDFDEVARTTLGRKDGKYFLASNPALADMGKDSLESEPLIRPVRGGFLEEPNYTNVPDVKKFDVRGKLSEQELRDLITAMGICATSNSNTITLVKNGQLIGNGVGQQDRVGAAELAVKRALDAGHSTEMAVAVSDSFFPYPDGPAVLMDAGIDVIYSTTGSKKDAEVQQTCTKQGVTLVQQPDADARMFYRH